MTKAGDHPPAFRHHHRGRRSRGGDWPRFNPPRPNPRPAGASDVDVAIIGAGLAGLTAARELAPSRPLGDRARGARPRRGARSGTTTSAMAMCPSAAGRSWARRRATCSSSPASCAWTVRRLRHGPVDLRRRRREADLQRSGSVRRRAARSGDRRRGRPDPRGDRPALDHGPGACAVAGARCAGSRQPDAADLLRAARSLGAVPAPRAAPPCAVIFGAEPRELSLLFTLFYTAASGDARHPGSFQRNFDTRGGAQAAAAGRRLAAAGDQAGRTAGGPGRARYAGAADQPATPA